MNRDRLRLLPFSFYFNDMKTFYVIVSFSFFFKGRKWLLLFECFRYASRSLSKKTHARWCPKCQQKKNNK